MVPGSISAVLEYGDCVYVTLCYSKPGWAAAEPPCGSLGSPVASHPLPVPWSPPPFWARGSLSFGDKSTKPIHGRIPTASPSRAAVSPWRMMRPLRTAWCSCAMDIICSLCHGHHLLPVPWTSPAPCAPAQPAPRWTSDPHKKLSSSHFHPGASRASRGRIRS